MDIERTVGISAARLRIRRDDGSLAGTPAMFSPPARMATVSAYASRDEAVASS